MRRGSKKKKNLRTEYILFILVKQRLLTWWEMSSSLSNSIWKEPVLKKWPERGRGENALPSGAGTAVTCSSAQNSWRARVFTSTNSKATAGMLLTPKKPWAPNSIPSESWCHFRMKYYATMTSKSGKQRSASAQCPGSLRERSCVPDFTQTFRSRLHRRGWWVCTCNNYTGPPHAPTKLWTLQNRSQLWNSVDRVAFDEDLTQRHVKETTPPPPNTHTNNSTWHR